MQDILKDIVKHTHSLGIIQAAKVTTDDEGTLIDGFLYGKHSMAENQ